MTVVKTSRSALAELILKNCGKIMTVVHVKTSTGKRNKMNVQILQQKPIGCILVRKTHKSKKDVVDDRYRQFYPHTLVEVHFKGKIYKAV